MKTFDTAKEIKAEQLKMIVVQLRAVSINELPVFSVGIEETAVGINLHIENWGSVGLLSFYMSREEKAHCLNGITQWVSEET